MQTDAIQLALHKLACEVDDVITNRAPTDGPSLNASGTPVHRMQYVEQALRELRAVGWTSDMLGAARWRVAS